MSDLAGDVANCGGCGRACATTNVAQRLCVAGLCTSTCSPGFGNCIQPLAPSSDDGCETDLNTDPMHCGSCTLACDTMRCCGGACAPLHQNGLGNTYVACAPLGSASSDLAFAACQSWSARTGPCNLTSCAGTVCAMGGTRCACWALDGTGVANHVNSVVGACTCPTSTDPTWN
jgi:hypothetical protein